MDQSEWSAKMDQGERAVMIVRDATGRRPQPSCARKLACVPAAANTIDFCTFYCRRNIDSAD